MLALYLSLFAIALARPTAWGPENITTVHVVQGCHLDVVRLVVVKLIVRERECVCVCVCMCVCDCECMYVCMCVCDCVCVCDYIYIYMNVNE